MLSSESKYIIYATDAINTRIRDLNVSLELANMHVHEPTEQTGCLQTPKREAAAY